MKRFLIAAVLIGFLSSAAFADSFWLNSPRGGMVFGASNTFGGSTNGWYSGPQGMGTFNYTQSPAFGYRSQLYPTYGYGYGYGYQQPSFNYVPQINVVPLPQPFVAGDYTPPNRAPRTTSQVRQYQIENADRIAARRAALKARPIRR